MNYLNFNNKEELCNLLLNHGIDPGNWKVKTLSTLYKEIEEGDCSLFIQGSQLLRKVEGAVVKCFYTNSNGENFQLVEKKQILKNGDIIERGHPFVAEKIKTGETAVQGAMRGLSEELHCSGQDIELIPNVHENKCDKIEDPDYKGLVTIYNSHVYHCQFAAEHYQESYLEVQEDKQTLFSWIKI